MLTSLYDRQVAMYQVLLEDGAAGGVFTLADSSQMVARNIVALEDAYGYRMVAGHATIDHAAATQLILGFARLATGHPLDRPGPPYPSFAASTPPPPPTPSVSTEAGEPA